MTSENQNLDASDKPARPPSAATRARRDAKLALAPFVAKLAVWHHQAARLFLELSRAEARQAPELAPLAALEALLSEVSTHRQDMADKAAALTSTRVDDLHRSFQRLVQELETGLERCRRLGSAA